VSFKIFRHLIFGQCCAQQSLTSVSYNVLLVIWSPSKYKVNVFGILNISVITFQLLYQNLSQGT
jgi:hypothetical protein